MQQNKTRDQRALQRWHIYFHTHISAYSLTHKTWKIYLYFGFKNHFSAYTKNGWKTNAVYCLCQALNLVSSYNPSVFLQHFFQKVEECTGYLTPTKTYHTSIFLYSSFLHPHCSEKGRCHENYSLSSFSFHTPHFFMDCICYRLSLK